ncbi:gamma-glutamyl-gamma-aminobutyrate hydrolase family protein [Streptomyces sp. NPDC055078]
MTLPRPLIAIPARFSATTSALRFAAEVNARALIEAVWRAGGEPVTIHPYAPGGFAYAADVAARLARFDGVLLPGGGEIAARRDHGAGEAGERAHDLDDEQDGFDLEVARQVLLTGQPLLAVCRGLQVVNTALGGTLCRSPDGDGAGAGREHRQLVHQVTLRPGSRIARIVGGEKTEVSCFHHQRVDRPGEGLRITARADDGTPEALEFIHAKGWLTAVQWHPEDTAHEDAAQQRIFDTLVQVATR